MPRRHHRFCLFLQSRRLDINKEAKGFLSEVVNTLRPYTIDGEVPALSNGHLKSKYPSGNHSFVLGTSPSDYQWKLNAKAVLKRFIYTEIQSSLSA